MPKDEMVLAGELMRGLQRARRPVSASFLAGPYQTRSTRRLERRIETLLATLALGGAVRRADAGWFAP